MKFENAVRKRQEGGVCARRDAATTFAVFHAFCRFPAKACPRERMLGRAEIVWRWVRM